MEHQKTAAVSLWMEKKTKNWTDMGKEMGFMIDKFSCKILTKCSLNKLWANFQLCQSIAEFITIDRDKRNIETIHHDGTIMKTKFLLSQFYIEVKCIWNIFKLIKLVLLTFTHFWTCTLKLILRIFFSHCERLLDMHLCKASIFTYSCVDSRI